MYVIFKSVSGSRPLAELRRNSAGMRKSNLISRKTILLIASDIRFWILLCFFVRLIGITHPPLEGAHNWRQTLGTMVIRNFYETDSNILYPRIDNCGDKAGITGMEFPLFNYVGYLLSLLFGYRHWYGRLINLIVSSFGIYMFYRFIHDHLRDRRLAFYSSFVLLFSLWFSYSRKIMPDTFSMSLCITAVYFGYQYFTSSRTNHSMRWINLLLFGIMATAGMLSKLSSGYLLAILAIPFFNLDSALERGVSASTAESRVKCRKDISLIIPFLITSLVCLSIIGIWYGYWVPYLLEKYLVSHFYFGTGFIDGFRQLVPHIPLVLERFYDTALKYVGFALSLLGLGWAFARRDHQILAILLFSFPPFLAIILVSGYNFAEHAYYIIPYVPIMALLAGAGLRVIKPHYLSILLMLAVSIENIVDRQYDFRIMDRHRALLFLATDLDTCSNRDALIAVNGSRSPTAIYFAHRKGWSLTNEDILNASFIEDLQKRGLQLIVILNNAFGASPVALDLPQLIETDAYTIYRLSNQ